MTAASQLPEAIVKTMISQDSACKSSIAFTHRRFHALENKCAPAVLVHYVLTGIFALKASSGSEVLDLFAFVSQLL